METISDRGAALGIKQLAVEKSNPDTLAEGDRTSDILLGTDGFDLISGLAGNDILVGRGGRDYLDGGVGNDILFGGPAAEPLASDNFSFSKHDGFDIIADFYPPGRFGPPSYKPDTIGLKDADSLSDINNIVATVTETPQGDAVLHYGETTILLLGVSGVEVIPEMFRFG